MYEAWKEVNLDLTMAGNMSFFVRRLLWLVQTVTTTQRPRLEVR